MGRNFFAKSGKEMMIEIGYKFGRNKPFSEEVKKKKKFHGVITIQLLYPSTSIQFQFPYALKASTLKKYTFITLI